MYEVRAEPFALSHSQSTFRRTEVCLDTPGSGVSQSGMGKLCDWGEGTLLHASLTLYALTQGLPSSCFIAMLKTMGCEPFSGGLDSAI